MRILEERIWMGMGGSVELKPLLSFKDPICPNMFWLRFIPFLVLFSDLLNGIWRVSFTYNFTC